MRPTSVNLARRPFHNNTLHYVVFATCFVLLMASTTYNVYDFVNSGSELKRLTAELDERTGNYQRLAQVVREMKRDLDRVDLATLNTKSRFANGLILSHLFSWSALFDRLEDLIPVDVKIRSIRPAISPDGIEIELDCLARVQEAFYGFEANLDGSDYFAGVYPRSESTREKKNELNFRLRMDYIPAGKSEPDDLTPPTPTASMPKTESQKQAAGEAAAAEGEETAEPLAGPPSKAKAKAGGAQPPPPSKARAKAGDAQTPPPSKAKAKRGKGKRRSKAKARPVDPNGMTR